MQWRGRTIVLALVIATLVVPFETFALPLVWWVNKLPWLACRTVSPALDRSGWLDTYRVQILPFIANAFSIYLFYSYFQSIPKELDEAARVDGAGWFRIYRSIVMPLAGPAIATVAILTFLPAWNRTSGRSWSSRPRTCGRSWSASPTSSSSTSPGAR